MPLAPQSETSESLTVQSQGTETLVRKDELQTEGLIPPFIPGPNAIPSAGGPSLAVMQES